MGPQRNSKVFVQRQHKLPAWLRPAPIALAISLAFGGLTQASALDLPASVAPPVAAQTIGVPRAGHEIVFVDVAVPEYDQLLRDFAPGIETIILSPDRDGVVQMAEALRLRSGLGAIHVLSHGASGQLQLGNGHLNGDNLASHAAALRQIGRSLAAGGDILLYGCEVGAGSKGAAFIDRLAQVTGADVAASTNRTGGAVAGGNWELEISTGPIEHALALNTPALANYDHLLITTSVNTVAGLKAAIATGNTDGSDDTITLTGDITFATAADTITINVTDGHKMTIVGGGHTLNAAYLARVISVTAGTVEIDNLTITHGLLSGNGGNGGAASGSIGSNSLGAGVANAGTLTILNSTISGNVASGGGGGGGGGDGSSFSGYGGGGGSGYSGIGGG